MKHGEEENYTLPVINIPYLSSPRNIKFPREISSCFTANSPYFAAEKKSISRVFFLLFGEISRRFRREKMHFIIAENKKWVIEFKSTVFRAKTEWHIATVTLIFYLNQASTKSDMMTLLKPGCG